MKTFAAVLSAALLAGAVVAPPAQAANHCYNKVIYHKRPVKDPHRVTGTAIGAALGGLLGHQVGGGTGRDLATVGGAVAGGVAGHKIQRHRQDRTYREVVRVCDR
jgi:uncharacterized protein YcfJ